jgi:predicted TIM-barrel fold metal-dependent hydrolase
MLRRPLLAVPLFLLAACGGGSRPGGVDAGLARQIAAIKAIDNHGHPLRLTLEGDPADDEYDALTFEEMEPAPAPVRIRDDNPEYIQAWKLLWNYRHNDMSKAHVEEVMAAKKRAMREKGDGYPAWVLDRLGIDVLLANRVAMGRGLAPPRFRWVSYVDALMFPLNNGAAKRENPDYLSFYKAQERLLERYLIESGTSAFPPTLRGYQEHIVTPTLEHHKQRGAVAVKFEAAYLRALDFNPGGEREAESVYAQFIRGGEPPRAGYKALQDVLFRYIAREAGRLGLAVHIHSCGGAGSYYKLGGTNPVLLDSVFADPSLRRTNFVLVHGGWPYTDLVGFLLAKPNVYTDISAMNFVLYPRELGEILRKWISLVPERVLYGGDVEPFYPHINWEETGWLTITTGRRALGMALTGMIDDGDITRERALAVARLIMRENAARLYGLK